jgi:hypothetical protein
MSKRPVSLYEDNKQIAALQDGLLSNDVGDSAAIQYRMHVERVIRIAMTELTGEATKEVTLDGGQMNAALQLLQQVKYKALDALTLGHIQKRARSADNKQ